MDVFRSQDEFLSCLFFILLLGQMTNLIITKISQVEYKVNPIFVYNVSLCLDSHFTCISIGVKSNKSSGDSLILFDNHKWSTRNVSKYCNISFYFNIYIMLFVFFLNIFSFIRFFTFYFFYTSYIRQTWLLLHIHTLYAWHILDNMTTTTTKYLGWLVITLVCIHLSKWNNIQEVFEYKSRLICLKI